jgi:hypothetical protein
MSRFCELTDPAVKVFRGKVKRATLLMIVDYGATGYYEIVLVRDETDFVRYRHCSEQPK